MWAYLEVVLWGQLQFPFLSIPAAQLSCVRIPSGISSSGTIQASAKLVQVNRIKQNQPEHQEDDSAPLKEVKISECSKPLNLYKATCASALSLLVELYLYSLQISCLLPQVLHQ